MKFVDSMGNNNSYGTGCPIIGTGWEGFCLRYNPGIDHR
jgi:hypothetical protein